LAIIGFLADIFWSLFQNSLLLGDNDTDTAVYLNTESSGNVADCINKVIRRWARLAPRWVTVHQSSYSSLLPSQLSLAFPCGKTSTDDGYSHRYERNGPVTRTAGIL